MSELRGAAFFAAVLATSAASGPASVFAQEPTEAELIQRVEALVPEWEAAREALAVVRRAARDAELAELERAATSVDTVRVGPMSLVVVPAQSEDARELVTEVWQERFPGVRESRSLREFVFAFHRRTPFGRSSRGPDPLGPSVRVDLSPIWAPSRAREADLLADAIARVAIQDFPEGSPMRAWLTAQSYPTSERVYRELATRGSGANRACLEGDLDACMAALGLKLAGSADRLAGWFSAVERQEMVEAEADAGRVDRDSSPYRRCVEENDARACDPLLAELDWITAPPRTALLRAHLLWFAAREGGEGSWQRGLERPDARASEVLASLSGRPVDELVAEWREEVIAQRPDVQAGLGGRGTRALLWSLVLTALALRSTRWRLA